MHIQKFCLLIAVAILAQATAAHGDDLTYSYFPDVYVMGGDAGGSFSFPTFDTGLGTLNFVSLTVVSEMQGPAFIYSISGSAEPGQLTITGNATASGPGLSVSVAPQTSIFLPSFLPLAPGPNYPIFEVPSIDAGNQQISTGLSPYETVGAGTVGFSFSSLANYSFAGSGDVLASLSTPPVWDLEAQVDYNYTPTPEPSSFVIAALGLFAIARRRNA